MDKSLPNKEFPFLNDYDLDQDVQRRLTYHLNSMIKGSNEVLLTPLGKDNDPNKLLAEFDKVVGEHKHKMNDVLIDLENTNRAKYGPRSIEVPWFERKDSLYDSYKADSSKPDIDEKFFQKSNLRPLSNVNAMKLLKNDTNSGLPYYTRKSKVKQRVLDRFDKLVKQNYPCILFTRTQEQKKTRNVWGYPIADTLREAKYYFPLLEYQKKLVWRSAIVSPYEVNRSMDRIVRESIKIDGIIVSADFSLYDTTVKENLQTFAFTYIKYLYQRSCWDELQIIADRFATIGILTPDGTLKGKHGVPSGSTFTNEVDSIVQFIIAIGLPFVKQEYIQIQGDDGVYLLRSKEEVESLHQRFADCGLVLNRDKSIEANNYALYLQNLYHPDYVSADNIISGVYPIYRALNRLVHQERWSNFEDYEIEGKDYYSIRAICIMENCKFHPLFKDLVKFILSKDKYSLRSSDQGIRRYVQMMSDSKGAGGILQNQYGDDVGGIRNFSTYKLIKELS